MGCPMSETEKSIITLVDEKGRKFLVKTGRGMQQISGIGVVDTDKLATAENSISVAGKAYNVLDTSLPDIINGIKRGPQWIMPKDAVQIVYNCGIGPGKKVLEVGTGTGALTIVMAYFVGQSGKIITYEIVEKHHNIAGKNIATNRIPRHKQTFLNVSCCLNLINRPLCPTVFLS